MYIIHIYVSLYKLKQKDPLVNEPNKSYSKDSEKIDLTEGSKYLNINCLLLTYISSICSTTKHFTHGVSSINCIRSGVGQ